MKKIDISLIYVYYNTPKELLDSLASVKTALGSLQREIVIVDNASSMPIPLQAKKYTKKIIVNDVNKGYGAAINQGAKIAQGELILIINPDTIFLKDSIYEMIKR